MKLMPPSTPEVGSCIISPNNLSTGLATIASVWYREGHGTPSETLLVLLGRRHTFTLDC